MPRLAYLVLGVVLYSVAQASAANGVDGPRVRPLGSHERLLLQRGLRDSPTIRQLVGRLEASDLIVFITLGAVPPGTGATTTMVAVAGTIRYLMVTLDPMDSEVQLLSRLGHELRHAVEIADASDVRSADGMRALLTRIGWRSGPDRWETSNAVDAARRVEREVTARAAPLMAHAAPASRASW